MKIVCKRCNEEFIIPSNKKFFECKECGYFEILEPEDGEVHEVSDETINLLGELGLTAGDLEDDKTLTLDNLKDKVTMAECDLKSTDTHITCLDTNSGRLSIAVNQTQNSKVILEFGNLDIYLDKKPNWLLRLILKACGIGVIHI